MKGTKNKKDTLYQLLNYCADETDEMPEAAPLTEQEVNTIMKKFRETHTETRKPGRSLKPSVIVLVAAAMIACLGTTTAAAARLGIFDNLAQKKDMTTALDTGDEVAVDKWAKDYNYEQIAEHAEELPEEITGEGDNLSVQVDEVYCDGCTTLISLSGSLKDGNPEHKQLVKLNDVMVAVNGTMYSMERVSDFGWIDGSLTLDEGTDNQFSGSIELITFDNSEITESGTAEITIGSVSEKEWYGDENVHESGGFALSVPLTLNHALRCETPYTITEDEYSVRFYEISPAMMMVGCTGPDEEASSWLYYENGEPAEQLDVCYLPDYGDGYRIGCMMPVTSGTMTARFFYRDAEGGVPKEITVNMEEVYAALQGSNET